MSIIDEWSFRQIRPWSFLSVSDDLSSHGLLQFLKKVLSPCRRIFLLSYGHMKVNRCFQTALSTTRIWLLALKLLTHIFSQAEVSAPWKGDYLSAHAHLHMHRTVTRTQRRIVRTVTISTHVKAHQHTECPSLLNKKRNVIPESID